MTKPSGEVPARLFDGIAEGLEVELSHVVTREEIETFASLSGDRNPLHLDGGFARRMGYRAPVVHGMLSASFVSTLIGTRLPGPGALWVSQAFDFLRPVYAGDTLTVRAVVRHKSASTRLLVLAIGVSNQAGDDVLSGTATVRVPDVEPEPVPPAELGVALVTGASRGIGAAVARRLAATGIPVALNYLKSDAAASAVAEMIAEAGGRPILARGDVSREAEVERIFKLVEAQAGPVGALVHAAAPPNPPVPFASLAWEQFDAHLAVQLRGAFLLSKRALPGMIERGSGAMVFIGSAYAATVPPPQQAAYVAAKGALEAFGRALASEAGPKGVRVNVVSPGMTLTERVADLPEKVKLLAKMQTPLRRLAEPADIAEAVAFLLSPGARHVTGETLRVGGGSSGP